MNANGPVSNTRARDLRLLLGILLGTIGALLLWVFYEAVAADPGPRLADIAHANVPTSGVSNPVTSVLLNFRAYDTLMELAVLLVALLENERDRSWCLSVLARRGKLRGAVLQQALELVSSPHTRRRLQSAAEFVPESSYRVSSKARSVVP